MQWVLGPALGLGLPGLLFVVWYFDGKARDRDAKKYEKTITDMILAYREDTQKILNSYREDTQTMRVMYESNVVLVKSYQVLCGDLKDIVILNSMGFQKLADDLKRKCAALKDD